MLLIPKLFVRNRTVASPGDKRGNFPTDPLQVIADWASAGIEMLHIVDLDMPNNGPIPNANLILNCIKDHHLRVHVGGHFKTIDVVQKYASLGVEQMILGSSAYQSPELLKGAIQKCPGKIGITLDVKNGKVVIPGWAASSHKTAIDYYDQFAEAGVSSCYYSDIVESNNDIQINLDGIRKLAQHANLPIYFNGEVMSVDDMAALLLVEKFGVAGCVLSKALYEQRLDLASSVTYLKERSQIGLAEETIMED